MYVTTSRSIDFRPDFSCRFPANLCVNCGATSGLSEQTIDARLVKYFLFFGTETRLTLPAAVCAVCVPSLRRHPQSTFSKLLIVAMICGFVMLAMLIPMQEGKLGDSFVTRHCFFLSVVFGCILSMLWFRLKRPKPPQTSYYQPIRVKRLQSHGGEIHSMTLGFTNAAYLRSFHRVNQAAIERGFIKVRKA
jgi:hypothetical protein